MTKMRNIYCIKCNKFRKFKNPEISSIFYKTLLISNFCDKCDSKHKRIFKEKESTEISKILGLIKFLSSIGIYNYFKDKYD